jgi:hypothetical protein
MDSWLVLGWMVGMLAVAGCPAEEDSDGGDDMALPADEGSSTGDGAADTEANDDANGNVCHTRLTSKVCPTELATWIEDGTASTYCEDVGGTGGPECDPDMPQIDDAAAAALCDEACGGCSCALGTYAGCEYQGLGPDGMYAFQCTYEVGCAGGGCNG